MKDNVQTKDSVRYVAMEVDKDTIKGFHLDESQVKWKKAGNKLIRAYEVPTTEEVYSEYMKPQWKEDKYQQRHGDMASLDALAAKFGLELSDNSSSVEEEVEKRELLSELRRMFAQLEEIDRIIVIMHANGKSEREIAAEVGMSQRGVGKRKTRVLAKLRDDLKDFF